jgi:lipopolysaccharide/colanic/teichoic acid biosynthesis glycosyltransferase
MELAYLPKTNKAVAKKYKHFTVNAYTTTTTNKEIAADKKTEFFYIGRNIAIIDKLVQSFESGYAAENIEKAISILTKITEKRTSCPDVILIEGSVNISLITSFYRFLSASNFLAGIPFLIEASSATEKELNDLRQLPFIDEIISVGQSANDKLLSKIQFITKIKNSNNRKELQKNIEQSFGTQTVKRNLLKGGFDILVSSVILLLLSPLFILIAIAIKIESKGPVFYIAKRAGRGYRIFNFYKFRTMEVGADQKVEQLSHLNQYSAKPENGPVFFKVTNDPRITKVGAFLRNSSLDEVPQLINVLLGDMSLVGNRPLPLYEAATLTTDVWAARFMAPAGITGLWQIKKRGQEDMSVEERISLDIVYANRNNFMYDLWIMANTPTALLQKSNV